MSDKLTQLKTAYERRKIQKILELEKQLEDLISSANSVAGIASIAIGSPKKRRATSSPKKRRATTSPKKRSCVMKKVRLVKK